MEDEEITINIKKIKELYEAEFFMGEKILKTGIFRKETFVLFDKEWLTKWKNIVCYKKLKDKCKNYEINEKISKEIIDEVRSTFTQNNTKKKLEELGKRMVLN